MENTSDSLSSREEALWRAFARVLHGLPRTLERELRSNANISSPDYAALANIAASRPGGLRVTELAALMGLSPSGASRLVDRLVGEGEVERSQSADDGRGRHLTITTAGLARLGAARPHHIDSVRRYVLDKVGPAEYEPLIRVFQAISREAFAPPAMAVEGPEAPGPRPTP